MGSIASCCSTPIATGCSTCWIATNGQFLSGTPFVYQNWNKGFDANGRPIVVPGSNSSAEGSFCRLSHSRRSDEFPGAVLQSPDRVDVSRVLRKRSALYQRAGAHTNPARQYSAGLRRPRAGGPRPGEPPPSAGIKAIDPETGKTMWDFKIFQGSLTNGVMATAGGVVFAATREGQSDRARRQDRQVPVAFPDWRQHGRVANELRGRREAARRRLGRDVRVQLRAAGVNAHGHLAVDCDARQCSAMQRHEISE